MRYLRNSFLALTFVGTSSIASAETIDLTFDISAVIPSDNFYVSAKNGWNTRIQTMSWNTSTNKLNQIANPVEIKGIANTVDVHLASSPRLGSGPNTIPLVVRLDTHTVPEDSSKPLRLTNANGREYSLIVGPAASATFTPGSYTGTVEMVFDSSLP